MAKVKLELTTADKCKSITKCEVTEAHGFAFYMLTFDCTPGGPLDIAKKAYITECERQLSDASK